jgi:hypothetical protein
MAPGVLSTVYALFVRMAIALAHKYARLISVQGALIDDGGR